ncbi:MAG: 3-hydroxyacyl-CoA dehydrogenase/enoyl-CoA hydratase family protein [Flavobacteriales bacterium]
MKNKFIHKVAVIGSGIMGSGIACHFANIGVQVLLLDLPDKDSEHLPPSKRNFNTIKNLKKAIASKPAPLYHKSKAQYIQVGNIEDDLKEIKHVDWIIEVVVEHVKIKQNLYENIEKYRNQDTIVTSNTSGIPIHILTQGRSDAFKSHFAGTHFFNPVRYLPLLEIIPHAETDDEIVQFLMEFGEKRLGKTTILCKDTPGFIGNRIGVYAMGKVLELADKYSISPEMADFLTGKLIGRPKTGTFKLADLVGIDTVYTVIQGMKANCKTDIHIQSLKTPAFLQHLIDQKFYGAKSKKGFYFKNKDSEGQLNRFVLDLHSHEYKPLKRPKTEQTKRLKQSSDNGLKALFSFILQDESAESLFLQEHFASLFSYSALKVPEISDTIYAIDHAMKNGFAWTNGPFEYWDILGFEEGIKLVEKFNYTLPEWIFELKNLSSPFFYSKTNGKLSYFNQQSKSQIEIPQIVDEIHLDSIKKQQTIWSNPGSNIIDLGDGIILLEFKSKMNSIGSHVLQGINKAIDLAESQYKGLVIGNQGENFSVGADLSMIFMLAVEQEFDELSFAIQYFQNTMTRIKHSSIPVVAAVHNMALGGGCEIALHADKVIAHTELYMGLVEVGVGVIPGGGGTKEMVLRASDTYKKGDIELNRLQENYMTIAMAKVSTSAEEAMELNFLKKDRDVITPNRKQLLSLAKKHALLLHEQNYYPPIPSKTIKVLGKQALGAFNVGAESMFSGKYISQHDIEIAKTLGEVMSGGPLSESTMVDEKYLLNLERKGFLKLCTQRKTLERIQHMLLKGKPLRN